MNAMDEQASTARPKSAATGGRKVVNLALQGGGSHGAFTWGVLDRLLEEKRLEFEGITATSAGAVNAVVLADGLAAGGREGARDALRLYWQKVSDVSSRGIFKHAASDKANSDFGLERSPGFLFVESMTFFASPYQMNPFNYNPVRDLLAEAIAVDVALVQQHLGVRSTSSVYASNGRSNCLFVRPTCRRPRRRSLPARNLASNTYSLRHACR